MGKIKFFYEYNKVSQLKSNKASDTNAIIRSPALGILSGAWGHILNESTPSSKLKKQTCIIQLCVHMCVCVYLCVFVCLGITLATNLYSGLLFKLIIVG